MKPRFTPRDEKFDSLLKEAQQLEERLEKASPDFQQKEGSKHGQTQFMTQSAGKNNVQNHGYMTNNVVPESEDVKNTGAKKENSKILDSFKNHYPNTESTIASHEGGSDERPAALKKMGTSGEQWRLDTITKSIHNLSRRLE
tara:strand:- start:8285 stop:8710 length:426 start_codon:yes stop_codon:yes gene_type:complete